MYIYRHGYRILLRGWKFGREVPAKIVPPCAPQGGQGGKIQGGRPP